MATSESPVPEVLIVCVKRSTADGAGLEGSPLVGNDEFSHRGVSAFTCHLSSPYELTQNRNTAEKSRCFEEFRPANRPWKHFDARLEHRALIRCGHARRGWLCQRIIGRFPRLVDADATTWSGRERAEVPQR